MTASRPTEPLRAEHRELLPHIERLRELGDLAAVARDDLTALHGECVDFLRGHLLVHAGAEEQVLYPAVGRALGAPKGTATMSRDHVEVEHLTAQLAATPATDRREVARLAYGLHALVSLHFAKEEEVYLPLLDETMAPDQVDDMYSRMEQAATTIRSRANATPAA